MAELLYGNLYFYDRFAGILRQEPDGRFAFNYDQAYLSAGNPAIAYTLPLQIDTLYSAGGLHSFFDNLVAEGWLAKARNIFARSMTPTKLGRRGQGSKAARLLRARTSRRAGAMRDGADHASGKDFDGWE